MHGDHPRDAVHALLYLIVSLLAVALVFFTLGAPFVAALEVIVYAGAIMVLFVFVVMMLNLGPSAAEQERRWLAPRTWVGPARPGRRAARRAGLRARAGAAATRRRSAVDAASRSASPVRPLPAGRRAGLAAAAGRRWSAPTTWAGAHAATSRPSGVAASRRRWCAVTDARWSTG